MSENMIKRVAREMRRNRFARTRRTVFDETIPPTDNELDDARAAIEAMRHATESMLVAAYGVNWRLDTKLGLESAIDLHSRMIDAALNTDTEGGRE